MANNGLKLVAILPLALGLLLGPITDTVLASPRQKKGSAPLHLLSQLRAPISISQVNKLRDGGTVNVVLSDAAERKSILCFDFRIGSQTPGRLYVGAGHPTKPGATLVPLGSDTQKKVVRLLRGHLDRQFSRSQQRVLTSLELQEVKQRHGENGVQAYWLLQGITALESLSARERSPA